MFYVLGQSHAFRQFQVKDFIKERIAQERDNSKLSFPWSCSFLHLFLSQLLLYFIIYRVCVRVCVLSI